MSATDVTEKIAADSTSDKGLASGEKDGKTSSAKRTFTEDEVNNRISDIKAAEGREKKKLNTALEETKTELNGLKTLNADISRRLEELEISGKDPASQEVIRLKRSLQEQQEQVAAQKRQLEKERLQLEEDRKELSSTKTEATVATIAAKHGVDPKKLASYGVTDPDKLEEIAKMLSKVKSDDGEKGADFVPDSGKSSGGGGLEPPTDGNMESYREYYKRRETKK